MYSISEEAESSPLLPLTEVKSWFSHCFAPVFDAYFGCVFLFIVLGNFSFSSEQYPTFIYFPFVFLIPVELIQSSFLKISESVVEIAYEVGCSHIWTCEFCQSRAQWIDFRFTLLVGTHQDISIGDSLQYSVNIFPKIPFCLYSLTSTNSVTYVISYWQQQQQHL